MEKEIVEKQRKVSKVTVKKMEVFKLINKAVELTSGSGEIVPAAAKPYLSELQSRLQLATIEEAAILCAFVDRFDDYNIYMRDIASHFKIRSTIILENLDAIEDLLKKQFIRKSTNPIKEKTYRLSPDFIEGLRNNTILTPKNLEGLDIYSFLEEVENYIERAKEECDVYDDLHLIINKNQQLHLCKMLKQFGLEYDNLLLYLNMCTIFIDEYDDLINSFDIDCIPNKRKMRMLFGALDNGTSPLITNNLVEPSCVDGQVNPYNWRLTDYSKEEVLQELKLVKPSTRNNLTHYEDIKKKKLFYNPRVTKEVDKLHDLLNEEKMKRVLKRMDDKGMRKGFTCIFYGGPGTGKTETVLQLARESKRDIMMVDVPNIRSKWVGDTEKNIKRVFEQYKKKVQNDGPAPILVFNEADAILTRRNEGGTSGVDKMENALQNIILQEMEDLEGIMIATTNLTGNLDSAFERRFLYKIEFDKPTANERQHIWKSMLPDLSDDQSLELAKKYDFSGGQIENIARKRIVSDILDDRDDINIEAIVESCDVELLKKNTASIGFV